jgi:hypothetical protein
MFLNVSQTHDCPLCIEGWQPAGIHPILGPVMAVCRADMPCFGCDGIALFPLTDDSMTHFASLLAARGYRIDFCMRCLGVTDVYPFRRWLQ